MAGPNIRFVGYVSDDELKRFYGRARALIQPSAEDFGLAAAEALLFGVPVVASRLGAAPEMVEPGVTGELFEGETPEVLADGVRRFLKQEGKYSRSVLHARADRYSLADFRDGLQAVIRDTGNV
jgi:glycosyltransferase involved in cell wall biosynthesis